MGWDIDYLPEPRVVRVRTEGVMRADDIRQMAYDALTVAAKVNACKFLVDHRRMTPDMGVIDIHDMTDVLARLGASATNLHVAALPSEDPAHRADFDFFQGLTLNRGEHYYRQFADLDAAMAWLAEHADPQAD